MSLVDMGIFDETWKARCAIQDSALIDISEIFYNKFGVSDAARVLLEDDPQILKAVELIPDAKELASKARRQLAEKR